MQGEIEPVQGQIKMNIGKLGKTHNSSFSKGDLWWPSRLM